MKAAKISAQGRDHGEKAEGVRFRELAEGGTAAELERQHEPTLRASAAAP
jgi:hypothetical protein